MRPATTLFSLLFLLFMLGSSNSFVPSFFLRPSSLCHLPPSNTIPLQSTTSLFVGRHCALLGKRPNRRANSISHSHVRTRYVQHLNLHKVRYTSAALRRTVTLRLSTKGMRTVKKYGGDIDAAAKKFKIDLSKFRV